MLRRALRACARYLLATVLVAAAVEKFLYMEDMGLRLARIFPDLQLSPVAGSALIALAGIWEAILGLALLSRTWRRPCALLAAITMASYIALILASPEGQCPCGEWSTKWFGAGRSTMIGRNVVLATLGVAVFLIKPARAERIGVSISQRSAPPQNLDP